MNRLVCPIRSIEHLNHDTRQVLLDLPPGETASFKAGQYLQLVLPKSVQTAAPGGTEGEAGQGLSEKANQQDAAAGLEQKLIKCPFSIASSPRQPYIELHIRPTPGSRDSTAVEAALNKSAELTIELPFGDCYLEAAPSKPLILIAASTGITQMKSIIEYLEPDGFKHPVHLYWGLVNERDLYLAELCESWVTRHEHFHFTPVVSEPETSPGWQGKTGLVGEVALADLDQLDDIAVIVAGGPAMVYATLDAFVARGMPADAMRSDIFTYAPR